RSIGTQLRHKRRHQQGRRDYESQSAMPERMRLLDTRSRNVLQEEVPRPPPLHSNNKNYLRNRSVSIIPMNCMIVFRRPHAHECCSRLHDVPSKANEPNRNRHKPPSVEERRPCPVVLEGKNTKMNSKSLINPHQLAAAHTGKQHIPTDAE